MSYFRNIFSKYFHTNHIILGRWNITYNKSILERKIYLANLDYSYID